MRRVGAVLRADDCLHKKYTGCTINRVRNALNMRCRVRRCRAVRCCCRQFGSSLTLPRIDVDDTLAEIHDLTPPTRLSAESLPLHTG